MRRGWQFRLAIIVALSTMSCARTGFDPSDQVGGNGGGGGNSPCPALPCDPGYRCNAATCVACDQDTSCGATCADCTLLHQVCGASGCERSGDCSGLPNFTRCDVVTTPDRDYDVCIDGLCVSPGCGDGTCATSGPSFALVDTSQTDCFDGGATITCPGNPGASVCGATAFCGQDAQYGWDPVHPGATRFVRSEPSPNQPVVDDTISGLMWQGCANGLDGPACENGSVAGTAWYDAPALCDDLVWGGFEDWYLPDAFELMSIMDFSRLSPAIDPVLFPQTSSYFWTSEVDDTTDEARKIHFDDAYSSKYFKTTPYAVRCVRLVTATCVLPAQRYTRETLSGSDDHPIVTDHTTEIVWQGCVKGAFGADCELGSATPLTWEEALGWCEASSWAGLDDWYLPNIVELRSIVDGRFADPAIDATVFLNTPANQFYSATTNPGNPTSAFRVSFGSGVLDGSGAKSGWLYLRCARREP